MLLGRSNQGELDGWAFTTHGSGEKCIQQFGRKIGIDHSEDLDGDRKMVLECILGKYGGKVWTGCIWLKTETSGGLL
jgi:hypothetical protein